MFHTRILKLNGYFQKWISLTLMITCPLHVTIMAKSTIMLLINVWFPDSRAIWFPYSWINTTIHGRPVHMTYYDQLLHALWLLINNKRCCRFFMNAFMVNTGKTYKENHVKTKLDGNRYKAKSSQGLWDRRSDNSNSMNTLKIENCLEYRRSALSMSPIYDQ